MSQGLVERQHLQDIGDAIRSKNGSTDTYTPAEMAQAISEIQTADEFVLVQKTVNANGQYNASDDSADGYSGVRVNVPNSYSASDEGKVVSNGDLVAQTTKQITANGTHDTTTNNSVAVNVPNSYATSDNGKVVVNQALVAQTSKNINANGTHDTTENNSVVVDVPNSYVAADEGKVVSGGALVGQTSRNVTTNGTYDTTENNEVVVNVSGGGGASGDPILFMVTASSAYSSAYSAQNAFTDSGFWGANGGTTEWLKIQFNDPVKITAIKLGNTFIAGSLHWSSTRIIFQASNDDTTWVDLYDATNLSDSPDNYYEYLLQNNDEYIYYRFLCYRGSYYACVGKIKLSFENASLITKTITQNGTYNASDDNADGYSSVIVNVQGGGSSYPAADAFLNGRLSMIMNLGNYAYGSYLQTDSQYVRKFLMSYARDIFGSTKGTSSAYGVIAQEVAITQSDLQGTLEAFVAKFPVLSSAEYYGYVYSNTQILSDIGAVLLGDFSHGGEATGNALSDSIDNYSAVLLQGIYNRTCTSQYNTSMIYILPELNTAYWTGMKDRNSSYECNVTFTDDSTVSLSGNQQVIIYGIP